MELKDIPGQEEIIALLSEPGAPPVITLDIGGGEDLNGNGLVEVQLDAEGNLVIRDV